MAPAAPSWQLFAVEQARALFEYAGMWMMDKAALPRGGGEPVVVFPGLGGDQQSTAPLKSFCEDLGYIVYDWGRGFNTGPHGDVGTWLDKLSGEVRELTEAHEQQASLIGWSLGGVYAREVAKLMPQRVRQVITIGTPVADLDQTHVAWLYRLLNQQGRPWARR